MKETRVRSIGGMTLTEENPKFLKKKGLSAIYPT
jgi:hypothetical protein